MKKIVMSILCMTTPVLAANFTAATGAGSDWLQNKTYMNELHTSYREHLLVVSQSVVNAAAFVAGSDVQKASIWSNMQAFCLNNWDEFVNHTFTSPTGVVTLGGVTWMTNTLGTIYNSQIEFLRVAGITNGFRRATAYDPAVNNWRNYNDAMYSYGLHQPGDIEGPWLREDLIDAFSALKWTRKRENGPAGSTNQWQSWRANSGTANIYWNLEYEQCTNDWIAGDWAYGNAGGQGFFYRSTRVAASNEAPKTVACSQARSQSKVRTQADVPPLALASNMTYDLETYFIDKGATNASTRFVDMDALGFSLNQWKLVDSQAGMSDVRPYMSDWYFDTDDMPFKSGAGIGAWSTTSPGPMDLTERVECDWALWLIKWNWSYVN